MRRSRPWLLAALLTAAASAPAPAAAAPGCGPRGYAYAGVQSMQLGHGIGATLTALVLPLVERGHVAGWVGVGGPDEGPNGASEWVQVGLNSVPGSGNKLYYEVARPSGSIRYVEIDADVPAGRQLRVAVLETTRQNVWRVWVNGRAVSGPIYLPRSHRRLTPMAMSESWDGGAPACNRYAYRFRQVVLAGRQGGAWQRIDSAAVLQDPGFKVVRSSPSAFLAATRAPVPARAQRQPVARRGSRASAQAPRAGGHDAARPRKARKPSVRTPAPGRN